MNRTIEAIKIINNLWNKGQHNSRDKESNASSGNMHIDKDGFLTYDGQYFRIKSAKLYTPPSHPIPLYMAASGPEAITAAATSTDGMITTSKPNNSKEVFDKFDQAAKAAGKDPTKLEKIGKPKISYSEDYDEAFKSTNFWRAGRLKMYLILSLMIQENYKKMH